VVALGGMHVPPWYLFSTFALEVSYRAVIRPWALSIGGVGYVGEVLVREGPG